ncbi:hypothetical protein [Martelella sp. HB161492]|uniref:hypothetical protein n=1 Tax=Martelella sp. HB161492 TaxID=2720726 RepID=UPI0015919BB6|nr:hypothetical protein [Martelella sp. HB161492]
MSNLSSNDKTQVHLADSIEYIRQMLGELRRLADASGEDMLSYLIDMAYIEATDLQSRSKPKM